MKNIHHICNNYISSKVHENLILEISKNHDLFQTVFVPVRTTSDIGKNYFSSENVDIFYFNYFFRFLKFFPMLKILIISVYYFIKLRKNITDFIICHNLWSDGMVAFFIHFFKKTPYLLVVRNTDMNVFLPKLIHYRWLIKLMVKKSEGLVFVNNVYKENFEKLYPDIFSCAKKIKVIPNGVDQFWLQNYLTQNCENIKTDSLVYVGAFNENKNIKGIFEAIQILRKNNRNFDMYFVGGDENQFKKLLGLVEIPEYIKVIGKIKDKAKLLEIYRKSKIFIMPSFFETFGLVYVEALLQGCAVIYSKGQGIDGMIVSDLVCSVDPYNTNEISQKIEYLLNNFEILSVNSNLIENLINDYNWNYVSNEYLSYIKGVEGNY
ncbi:UDP-D-galactose:(glucosyl)lipopolysaccharide-1,6-D-galactosyltransferase [compost metagenome]